MSGGKVTDAAGNYIGINQFKPKERPGFGLKKTPTTSVGFGLEGGSSGGGGGSSSILQNQPRFFFIFERGFFEVFEYFRSGI